MSDLFESLGINWMLLIAQIVNFAILAFVLTKFVYKPVINLLNERKQRINKDLDKSKELQKKLEEADKTKEEILTTARKESEKIIKQSEKNAENIKSKIVEDAGKEVEKIKLEAQTQISNEKEKTMQELKKELGSLISLSVEKTIGDIADANTQKKLVEEALKKGR